MLKVVWEPSRRAFERRMRHAQREMDKALRKNTRKAGGLIRTQARRNLRAQGLVDTRRLWRAVAVRVRVKRRPLLEVSAAVLPTNKRRYFPAALYAPALERGGSIYRRQSRSSSKVRRRAHRARFRAKPWFGPAVKRTERDVYRLIGKTFNAV